MAQVVTLWSWLATLTAFRSFPVLRMETYRLAVWSAPNSLAGWVLSACSVSFCTFSGGTGYYSSIFVQTGAVICVCSSLFHFFHILLSCSVLIPLSLGNNCSSSRWWWVRFFIFRLLPPTETQSAFLNLFLQTQVNSTRWVQMSKFGLLTDCSLHLLGLIVPVCNNIAWCVLLSPLLIAD